MARTIGDGGSAAGSSRKGGTKTAERPALAGEAPSRGSGVFAKFPHRQSQAPQRLPEQFERAGAVEKPVLVRTGGRSRAGRLRLLRGGAVAVLLVGLPPDVAESLDRGKSLMVEISAALRATTMFRPLIEIHMPSDEPEFYVGAQRVDFRGNARLLLQCLVKKPGMSAPNDEIEHVLWPHQEGDLPARRRELVSRINNRLKRALGLEPCDDEWHGLPLFVESADHTTHINPNVCRTVWDKV